MTAKNAWRYSIMVAIDTLAHINHIYSILPALGYLAQHISTSYDSQIQWYNSFGHPSSTFHVRFSDLVLQNLPLLLA